MPNTPEGTETILCPTELDSLIEEFEGIGADITFTQIAFDQLDDCSEDPERDGPLPSILLITYRRYQRIYAEPVCGRCCASKKVRALLDGVNPPSHIHVHVLSQPRSI